MKKLQRIHLLLFIVPLISFLSCNNDVAKTPEAKESTDTTIIKADTDTLSSPATFVGGTLDTLYATKAQFLGIPAQTKKLVFSFTFKPNDKLIMHGWAFQKSSGRDFDDPADLVLKSGKPMIGNTYGPGTFFGNVIVDSVRFIKGVLRQNTNPDRYVIFVPNKLGNHISYNIFVTDDDPVNPLKSFAPIPVGFANPSPPKNR